MAQVKALIGNIKGKDGMANVYSTSETVIGTWNGATLYRKMIQASIPSTTAIGTKALGSWTSGISYAKVKSVYMNGLSKDSLSWSSAGVNGVGNAVVAYANGTNVNIENYDPYYNSVSCYIVIEYIK